MRDLPLFSNRTAAGRWINKLWFDLVDLKNDLGDAVRRFKWKRSQ